MNLWQNSRASSASSDTLRYDLKDRLNHHSVLLREKNTLVWDEESPEFPLNWGLFSKCYTTTMICFFAFFTALISTAGTAAAGSAKTEYGVSRTLAYFAFVTTFQLGQAIGGITTSSLSEYLGRRTFYIAAGLLFTVCSAIVGAVPSLIAVCFGRFFQGIATAIPATVALGTFNDIFDAQARIWVVYGFSLACVVGLAVGPIYSTYLAMSIGWRWIFYIATIVMGIVDILCLFIRESNASRMLEQKTKALRKETGMDNLTSRSAEKLSIKTFATNAILRPVQFLFIEPIVLFCAALCAIAFSLTIGMTESLNLSYTAPPFNFSSQSASLSFVPIIIGELLDFLPRLWEYRLLRKKRRDHQRILPENKIQSLALACPALAIGLWIFAWTIPPRVTHVPWPISMIGLILVGVALNDFNYVLLGYLTDSYGPYAASAAGAVAITCAVAGATLPLFTYQMYTSLGNNVATSIFASIATLFCVTPFLFLMYGEKLRKMSKYTVDNEQVLAELNKHMEISEQELHGKRGEHMDTKV